MNGWVHWLRFGEVIEGVCLCKCYSHLALVTPAAHQVTRGGHKGSQSNLSPPTNKFGREVGSRVASFGKKYVRTGAVRFGPIKLSGRPFLPDYICYTEQKPQQWTSTLRSERQFSLIMCFRISTTVYKNNLNETNCRQSRYLHNIYFS